MLQNMPLESALRRYVLGDLDDADRLEIEHRLIVEPDVFDQLGVVEQDLTEEYLDRSLTRRERLQFTQHVLGTPAGVQRLALVRALKRHSAKPQSRASRWHVPWSPASFGAIPSPRRALVGGIALAVLGVVALVGTSYVSNRRLPTQRAEVQAGRVVERAQGGAPGTAPARTARPADRLSPSNAELNDGSTKGSPLITSTVVALYPGTLRSGGSTARVVVTGDTKEVQLDLHTYRGHWRSYRVNVSDADGTPVAAETGLAPESTPDGVEVVRLTLPARVMAAGDYRIELSGLDPAGTATPVATYSLRVTDQK
jgi:hypothetical protein